MKKILVVTSNWLGDVLFQTPALRALRKQFPQAHIACWTPPRCAAVLKNNPHVNEVLVLEDRLGPLSWPKVVTFTYGLRRRRFDTAIFFLNSRTRAAMAAAAGIGCRAGFRTRKGDHRLTHAVDLPEPVQHRTDLFLTLLNALGVASDGTHPEFHASPEAGQRAAGLLQRCGIAPGQRYAVLHAGGNWELKRWPQRHAADWIRLYIKERGGSVVLTGSHEERPIAAGILSQAAAQGAVSLCGETDLDMLAHVMRGAELVVSNDSGPLHLAASQGVPLAAVFGPTLPEITGPRSRGPQTVLRKDVGCELPCYFRSCDTRVCLDWITPAEVFARSMELVAR